MEKAFTGSFRMTPYPAVSEHPSLVGHRCPPTPNTTISLPAHHPSAWPGPMPHFAGSIPALCLAGWQVPLTDIHCFRLPSHSSRPDRRFFLYVASCWYATNSFRKIFMPKSSATSGESAQSAPMRKATGMRT